MENFNNYKKLYDWKKATKRKWVDKEIEQAPIWCSVDLRDGNQALANPMNLEEKIRFFDYLVSIGFKEIEIGFPAASDTEYNFTRYLIENNKIPDDAKIQVLTQAREEIIKKTFDSLKGVKNAIVHLYNSTSKIQREVVFRKSKEEVKDIAVNGARMVMEYAKQNPDTNWYFEYSPESFSTTEMDYAVDVINGVLNEWKYSKNKPIINLPATIECSMPNVFADQVEYIEENINNRENVVISVHAHNDRGTGVATSEMAILAGADRVEGALFGNGERTGNADILNIAMNMYVLGVDPKIDFSKINEAKEVYQECTKMEVSPRHPYAGELVFTAFSGSHQDAISKGLNSLKSDSKEYWEVPYLPLNPADVNRQYEPIIRINSQSGRGGVSFVIENEAGYSIPQKMRKEIGYFIKEVSDKKERELTNDEIISIFENEYANREDIIKIESFEIRNDKNQTKIDVRMNVDNAVISKSSYGNGPIDAFVNVLKDVGYNIGIKDYIESSINDDNQKSTAVSFVNIDYNGKDVWAVGKDADTIKSCFMGITSAINRI